MNSATKSNGKAKMPAQFLLTVLGTNPQRACYALGGQQAQAQLAPLALIELLPETERPESVVALCTPESKAESLPLLEAGLRGRCEVISIEVPAGDAQEDVKTYLLRAASAIPVDTEVDLIVDVTHGYRHFSYLTYLAVLYLVGLRGVRLRGAYYGLLRKDGVSPFLDLRPLLELPRWFHALEVLRETGSALPMAAALNVRHQNPSARTIARELVQISEGYLSGLPLELGQHARLFCEQRLSSLKKILDGDHSLPLATELVKRLREILGSFALEEQVTGDGWKSRVPLSKPELERQGRIIDDFFRRKSISTGLGLLNEWTVSWVTWRLGTTSGWLDFKRTRRSAANLLRAMAAVGADPDLRRLLTEEQRLLGKFWGNLCELRNGYHHHGMRAQLVGNSQSSKKFADVQNYWETVLRSCPILSLALGGSRYGRVLISPMGRSPGVLFSALHACRATKQAEPALCLVICSKETDGLIAEASNRAGYAGAIEKLRLDDPFGGRPEIERLVRTARPLLLGADEVLVNVTGGTTLMGLAAEALADAARKLARPVRRFGLIDRRRPEHQEADPFQSGEPYWLDSVEGADGEDD